MSLDINGDSIADSHTSYSEGMTPSECSTCGKRVVPGIQTLKRVFGVWHQWRQCFGCWDAERQQHARDREDDQRQAAIRTTKAATPKKKAASK